MQIVAQRRDRAQTGTSWRMPMDKWIKAQIGNTESATMGRHGKAGCGSFDGDAFPAAIALTCRDGQKQRGECRSACRVLGNSQIVNEVWLAKHHDDDHSEQDGESWYLRPSARAACGRTLRRPRMHATR